MAALPAADRRRRVWAQALGAAALLLAVMLDGPVAAAEPAQGSSDDARTLLILPFDMVDSSLQGEMNHGPLEADVARLRRTEDVVHRSLDGQAEFEVISSDHVASQITEAQGSYRYLYACNGCEIDLGKAAGADLVMTGWVQKVSNLIININATLYDVAEGKAVGGASVDMRGNTDDTWRRAALYLVEHSLLANYHSRQAAAADAAD